MSKKKAKRQSAKKLKSSAPADEHHEAAQRAMKPYLKEMQKAADEVIKEDFGEVPNAAYTSDKLRKKLRDLE